MGSGTNRKINRQANEQPTGLNNLTHTPQCYTRQTPACFTEGGGGMDNTFAKGIAIKWFIVASRVISKHTQLRTASACWWHPSP